MPELPDVEAYRRALEAQGLVGQRFTGATILWPKAVQTQPIEDFVLGLTGRRVREMGRRAKYLIARLDNGHSLIFHLRMTGSLLVEPSKQARHPMTRNYFSMDDGRELRFVDPRKMGMVWLVADESEVLKGLGPEPLEPAFTPSVLAKQLARHKAPIKALLCDQSVVAGIGNIYADEALFAAAINPLTLGSDLKDGQIQQLHKAIVSVLREAVEAIAPLGYQAGPPTESSEGLATLRVPRREGSACRRCGGAIRRVPVRGRSTYWCGKCQR
jgi:formamidopyrimidine-DNA glycosylase